MANRTNTLLLKRSNVPNKIPQLTGLTLGEMALNVSDAKLYTLYTSGLTSAIEVRQIGWDRLSITGGTVSGDTVFTQGLTASTISATTYQNLPPFSGGTATGGTINISAITANTIYTDYIDFNQSYTGATAKGRINWDSGTGTLNIGVGDSTTALIDLQVGQEEVVRVYNDAGSTLLKGEIVYVSGSQGNRPAVKRASATSDGYSVTTLGMVDSNITSGAEGYVTTFGIISNLNTLGLTGGTPVWLSPTVAGGYTSTKPQAPYHTVLIGYVVRVSATVGSIFVNIANGWELDELHDVRISASTEGDLLVKSSYSGTPVWINTKTLPGSYTITGNTTIGGTMSASTAVTNNLTVSGGTGINWISGNTSTDMLRVTQTGSGNAFVVEDSTNPDSSPFAIDSSGNVGIGITSPTYPLDVRGDIRMSGSPYSGSLLLRFTSNNTLDFYHTGIGSLFTAGPTNIVSFGDQSLWALKRGGIFASDQPTSPFGLQVSGLPSMLSSTIVDLQSIDIAPTINNNSLYTGITRGIYYHPTVTSLGSSNIHRAIETVRGDVIFGSTSGNVGIGTTSPRSVLEISGTTTPTSGTARNTIISGRLSATTNDDTLVGLDIAPSYSNGSFTGVTNVDLRTNGINTVFGSSVGYGSTYGPSNDGVVQIKQSGATGTQMLFKPSSNPAGFNSNYWGSIDTDGYNFNITGPAYGGVGMYHGLSSNSAKFELPNVSGSTGNTSNIISGNINGGRILLQTFVNSPIILSGGNVGIGTTSPSERLQVSGNTLINGTLSATTISATTYQNLPNSLTGLYLPTSGGTVSGNTIFTSGITANTISANTLTITNNIDSPNRKLFDQNGLDSLRWDSRYLLATDNTPTVDWENTILTGIGGAPSLNWSSGEIRDTGPNLSIDWNNRLLTDGSEVTVLDWNNKIMTGMTRVWSSLMSAGTISVENITVTSTSGVNVISGNTSTDLLRVTQTGTGNAFVVEDSTNPDTTPFVITSVGNVGMGLTSPSEKLQVSGNTLISGTLSATTISATTYQNLPTDITVTGSTYSNNTFTFTNNTGGTFNVLFNTVTGLTVNGNLTVTGNTSLQSLTATTTNINGNLTVTGNTNVKAFTGTTGYISGSGQSILTVIGSGNSTTSPLFSVQGSQGELFSVTDSLTGSLFSVNDISGLPILEVFSDNTTLWGSYLAPSLNTTVRISAGTGSNTVYTIPQSAYTGAFFEYVVTSSVGARAGNIMSIFSGSSVQYTETTTNDIGTTTGLTFSVSANSTNAVLLASGATAGWTIKTIVRSI